MYLIDSFGKNIQTFEEAISAYESAKIWLEEKGVRVNVSRFQKNKKLIEKNKADNLKEDFDLLWANIELHDICEIHRHLSTVDSSGLTESLKKAIKGHELLSYEKKDGGSVHGRNFTFELYTAARMVRGGYEVSFDTDADINFIDNERLFHVECKRVVSENNLDSLIDEALSQIDRRCEGSSSDRGIVAISLSKLIFKAIDIEAKGAHANIAEMQETMRGLVGKWSQLIRHLYSKKSTKTIGLILHYKMPLRDEVTGAAAFLNRFSMVAFDNGHENNMLASEFSERMRISIEGCS